MFNIIQIIKNNRNTYYNYRTGKLHPIWKWYLFVSIASLLLTVTLSDDITNFVVSVLTAQSILVGFSFSVLFFLLSEKKPDRQNAPYIEDGLKEEKLSKLSKELFHNVSYFNVSSLSCLCLSLIIIATPHIDIKNTEVTEIIKSILSKQEITTLRSIYNYTSSYLSYFIEFLFYFTLIDSISTFMRTVGRVIFYFEKKIDIT